MAKGGSGDIPAGMIGSLVGQGPTLSPLSPAAYFHGAAGDSAAKRLGSTACSADLLSEVPAVLKNSKVLLLDNDPQPINGLQPRETVIAILTV